VAVDSSGSADKGYEAKMSAPKIRVLIVDDSAVVRQTLKEVLSSDPQIEVIATAGDPFVAADRIAEQVPDVITLDIEMPRMDGLTFLKKIMSQHPIPVVICSSLADEGTQSAFRALEYGAVDIITKPRLGTKQFLEESRLTLCETVKAAAEARLCALRSSQTVQPKLTADAILSPATHAMAETTEKVVVIGASTGGTEALKTLLEALPSDAPGIVIVQHMPELFTRAFANRLDGLCSITVKEAETNDTILRGRALIAPGNHHLLLKRSGARYYVEIKEGPLVCRHRPSVDVLFRSAARYAGRNAVGVILTGMGDDGARGMLEMKQAGATTIAQDEASCVVFGMPKEAIKLNCVDKVVPLDHVAGVMLANAR
jgi:two-component system chemotaxis response regulator CheB